MTNASHADFTCIVERNFGAETLPVVSYEVHLVASVARLDAVHADRISVCRIARSAPRWQHI